VSRWRVPEFMNAPVLGAVVLLALNDHLLKTSAILPAVVTGKLSDFAGLFYFPLLLVALLRTVGQALGVAVPLRTRTVAAAVVGTGFVFAAVKTSARGAATYTAVLTWLTGHPAHCVVDPTDLLALVVLPLCYLHGRRFCEPRRAAS
jgi:hypothetical protein